MKKLRPASVCGQMAYINCANLGTICLCPGKNAKKGSLSRGLVEFMKKYTKAYSALLCCLLLAIAAAFSVSAANNTMMPRTGEDGGIIGDVTGAINDAAGLLTDDHGTGTANGNMTEPNVGDNYAGNDTAIDSGTNYSGTDKQTANGADKNQAADNDTVSGTATDTLENAAGEGRTNSFVGIIVAIIIAIAVILLIIALMPKKRAD